jgi:hypothetical protein
MQIILMVKRLMFVVALFLAKVISVFILSSYY